MFGGDVRTTLGNAINCPQLAHVIATKCVLDVCVGHETRDQRDLQRRPRRDRQSAPPAQFAAFRIDVFHFISGDARFVDDNQDGVADRIVDGNWDAEMNLGLGLRHTPATFTATRELFSMSR